MPAAATPCRYTKRAFSLIELLVTIGVLSVLASMLLPSLARSRNKARHMECISNCKQVAMAIEMYTSENNGHYPLESFHAINSPGAENFWTHKVKEFFGDSKDNTETVSYLSCPGMPIGEIYDVNNNEKSNYMVNETIFRGVGITYESLRNNAIKSPERTMSVICGSSSYSTLSGVSADVAAFFSRCGDVTRISDGTLRFPHLQDENKEDTTGQATVIYGDGHVEPVFYADAPTSSGDVFWNPEQ